MRHWLRLLNESNDDTMRFLRDLESSPLIYDEPEEFEVRREGDLMYIGTHDACIDFIMNHQTHTVDDALDNGGWEIGRFAG